METSKSFSQMLRETGRVVYTTRGFSMRPLLRQGKDVVVIETPKEHWKKYDAVLFLRRNGQYVLHRILKVCGDKYWIVGDNCVSGEMVSEDQMLGVLTSVRRGQRTIYTTDLFYRLYVRCWCAPYPLRFLLLRAERFAYRALRFVKRRLFG